MNYISASTACFGDKRNQPIVRVEGQELPSMAMDEINKATEALIGWF